MIIRKQLIGDLTIDELQILIQQIMVKCFLINQKNQETLSDGLITMKEVAALYKVSLVTIHKWRKHKILPPTIKKGGRVFFRRDEIIKSLEK